MYYILHFYNKEVRRIFFKLSKIFKIFNIFIWKICVISGVQTHVVQELTVQD